MKVIVCIKQVPDTQDIKIDPQTNTLIREGVKSIINPFDMYAVEETVRIKEKYGAKTVCITMGPPQAEQALREVVSLGIDEVILVSDRAFAGSDTWATSNTLSAAIKKIGGYDLVICGKQAADGDTAQVGPGISTFLDIPQITYVKKIETLKPGYIKAERMTEEGFDIVESSLPAVITVVKEINEPRLPSLKGMMLSKKIQIPRWGLADIGLTPEEVGLKGSPTQVMKIFTPPRRSGGKVFNGPPDEVTTEVVNLLKDILL